MSVWLSATTAAVALMAMSATSTVAVGEVLKICLDENLPPLSAHRRGSPDSGFDLAQQLADNHPHIILISTHREEDFADLIAESPARGFLAKSDLSKQAIQHILQRPQPQPQP